MKDPIVSAIIPAYNAATTLWDAVQSVRRQRGVAEIVIIDDGSTDDTPRVVSRLGADIRYQRQANAGPAAARNRGLDIARGEVIAFLDADDMWPPDKLDGQLRRLAAQPKVDIVMGRVRHVRGGDLDTIMATPGPPSLIRVEQRLGAAIIRRSAFDAVGRFDESQRYAEDIDFFLRVREAGIPMVVLDAVALLYRSHDDNMTKDKQITDLQIFEVLKKSLDRRRTGPDRAAPAVPTFGDLREKDDE